jgi:predicted DNA-binding transcriptional regulator AlpA
MDMNTTYYDTKHAAAYLGVGESTLERLRVTGGGPVFRKLGEKMVRYAAADLDAWARPATSTSEGVTA